MRILRFSTLAAPLLGIAALASWLYLSPREARATPVPKALQVVGASDAGALDAGIDAGPQPIPTTATIIFQTVPYVTATVTWGRKPLGRILPGKPLVVVRPRDSGPLDVIVRANGYLPVQTRAHTFADTRVMVKLTPPDKKNELLGYRLPIDAGPDGSLEGGLPEGGMPDVAYLPVFPPPPVSPVPTPAPTPPIPAPEPFPVY